MKSLHCKVVCILSSFPDNSIGGIRSREFLWVFLFITFCYTSGKQNINQGYSMCVTLKTGMTLTTIAKISL